MSENKRPGKQELEAEKWTENVTALAGNIKSTMRNSLLNWIKINPVAEGWWSILSVNHCIFVEIFNTETAILRPLHYSN